MHRIWGYIQDGGGKIHALLYCGQRIAVAIVAMASPPLAATSNGMVRRSKL